MRQLLGVIISLGVLGAGCASGPNRPSPGQAERLEVTAKQLRPLISLKSRPVVRSAEEEQVALLEEQAIAEEGGLTPEEQEDLASRAAPVEEDRVLEGPEGLRVPQAAPSQTASVSAESETATPQLDEPSATPLVGTAFLQQQFMDEGTLTLEELRSLQAAAAPEVEEADDPFFLVRLHFDYKQAVVKAEYQPGLRELAFWLRQTEARILLEGHCDDRGSNGYNLGLGSERAEEVKAYLVGLGVAPDQVETVSFGEERPLSQERTEAAHAMNRRVEVVFLQTQKPPS